ncbi:MAG: TonB-dependent receptor [Deltaproteobacteria bacterium]|nr:TonB-dependent receptor [Deltaproteobacteria bacterium]
MPFLVLPLLLATPAFAVEETETISGKRTSRETLDIFHLSKQPKLKQAATPVYPPAALARGISSEVTLLIDIDERGEVGAAVLAEPASEPGLGFEEAALEAAYGLAFEPAEIDGKPVAVQVSYQFKFRPPVKPEAPSPAPDGGADGGAPPYDGGSTETGPEAGFDQGGGVTGMPLRGRLLERGTRAPLQLVTVFAYREVGDAGLPEDAQEVSSDDDGRFVVTDLAPGRWTLLAENPGYLPFKTTEEIRPGEQLDVTYYLERQSANPFDVVVTSVRGRKEVSRTVLDYTVIEKVPGAAGDPLTVVQNLAGVARVPLGSGEIIVRGSAPRDTRVYVAGAEVPTVYHFSGLRSVLPLAVVDAIDFYPSNFSSYYGRATGGIVDVSLKRLRPRRASGYVDLNLLDSGFYLAVPLLRDRATIVLAARRSYVDALLAAFFPGDSAIGFATAPRYYDYQAIAQYRLRPGHDFRFMLFGSDDRLTLLFKQPADFDAQAGGNQFGLSTTFYRSLFCYAYVPSEDFSNTLRISQGRNWLAFGIGVLSFDINVYTSQIRDTARFRFGDRLAWSLGADVLFLRGSGTIALPPRTKEGQPPANTDYSAIRRAAFSGLTWWSPALFSEIELRPWQSLLLVPGARVDYYSRTDEWTIEPRLSARKDLGKAVTLKGGVGLFHQEPDFGEDYPGFGNPELRTEKAWHYAAGAEWQVGHGLSLDATLFHKSLFDLVSPTTETTLKDGVVTPLIYDNGGRGRVAGFEMLLRRDFSDKLTGWIAYTLSRSERRDSGADDWRLFDYDQTHILTALGSYKFARHFTLGARFRYVSGNPRTPVVGSVVNASADRYEPLFGAVNSARNPAFHQLDIRIDKRWVFDRWILDTYLDVQNVYNYRYAEGLQYSYDYAQSQPQAGLPILTIFGVRGEI